MSPQDLTTAIITGINAGGEQFLEGNAFCRSASHLACHSWTPLGASLHPGHG